MSDVFERLIGLETEYAIRFHPSDPSALPPHKFRLYEALRSEVQRRVLTVPAKHFKEGVFTAAGGAVWFEAERPSAGGGLIEGATPECRGPRQTLVYQRAMDHLLSESALAAGAGGQFCLIKNDRDGRDNIYGAQENYEATFASGLLLAVWRIGLVVLFPLVLLTWLAILLSVVATLAYFVVAGLIYLLVKLATGGRKSLALALFGRDLVEGRETCIHVPVWLESALQLATRLVTAPLAIALYGLLYLTAFCRLRSQLLPFLISRPIIAGAGTIDSQGRFQLSDKAPAINCVLGFGGMLFDRPIFSMGHFFKAVYAESWFSPRLYCQLFTARHRLQIALGDSNMCQPAELLRVGTTALVLDAIEAGALDHSLVLRDPIRALHTYCADPTLRATVSLKKGNLRATALELQRYYLYACRSFLNTRPEAPSEAWEIIHRWEETLEALAQIAEGTAGAEALMGKVDWVTKKYLLDKVAGSASWAEKKKIDIRYHELSPQGYFRMLDETGLTTQIVQPEEIERAVRSAPPNSPATTRGHYIREFAFGDEPVRANWKSVVIGRGWDARVIHISRYGHPAGSDRSWWPSRRGRKVRQ